MISLRTLVMSVLCVAVVSSLGLSQDLGTYRMFQFGMGLEAVATKVQMKAADAKTIHQRPAAIQTLQWDLSSYPELTATSQSLRSIRFGFFNGELSRMVVTYDSAATGGLSTNDMIEALSTIYGAATMPAGTIAVSSGATYEDNEKVLARWEDAKYSYNLFHYSYENAFGVLAFSKALDLLTIDANKEAERLDKLEAPEKESARLMKQEDDKRSADEKARFANKPKFRP